MAPRRDLTNKLPSLTRVEKIFIKIAPWLIALAAILLFITLAQLGKTSRAVEVTSAYTRVSNCILGKSAYLPLKERDIEKCYTQVEMTTDIELQRFDNQN